jgi:hypothetical protein
LEATIAATQEKTEAMLKDCKDELRASQAEMEATINSKFEETFNTRVEDVLTSADQQTQEPLQRP